MVQGHYAIGAKINPWQGFGNEALQIQKIKRKTTIEAVIYYLSCYFAFFSLI